MRDTYADLMAYPQRLEEILQVGAAKARALSQPFMQRLREAVGLRQSVGVAAGAAAGARNKAQGKGPKFVSFRDDDGSFRFRMLGTDGTELLRSVPYADPRQAGQAMKLLREGGGVSIAQVEGRLCVLLNDAPVAE